MNIPLYIGIVVVLMALVGYKINIALYVGLAAVVFDLLFMCHKRMGGCGRIHWISTNCKRKQ